MYNCSTQLIHDRIHIHSPFAMKDEIKAIAGAQWNKRLRLWWLPATITAAKNVIKLNGAHSDEVYQLAAKTSKRDEICIADDKLSSPKSKTTPWQHQLIGYHLIKELPATMLAWEMGVGKTKAVVDAFTNSFDPGVALVVCPKSVIDTWPAEFSKHSSEQVVVMPLRLGTITKRAAAATLQFAVCEKQKKSLVIVINYEAAWRGSMADLILSRTWDMVVADESHRIKSPGGKASRFMAKIKARRKVALTGTPMPHSPLDTYGQYRYLDPSIFGTSFVRFRNRYAVMGGYENHQILRFQNQDDLHDKFYSIGHRVRKNDVLDLPPITHENRLFNLCPEAARVYDELEQQLIADVGSGVVIASNALARLMRFQQITSGFVVTDEQDKIEVGDGKYKLLLELISDLPSHEPIVVFCRFHHDLDRVHEAGALVKESTFELSGRGNMLAEWKEAKGGILAVQIQAGGVGVDLSKAAYCVYFSLGFSLGDYLQSMARLNRPGQTRSVTYIHLIARGTIDQKVHRALASKKKVVDAIIDEYKGKANEMV